VSIDLTKHTAYGGLDLASTLDLTAFVLIWPVGKLVYVHPWFWIPEKGLKERCRRDNVPYDLWAEQGHIELTPQTGDWNDRETDHSYLVEKVKKLCSKYTVANIGFDRWRSKDTVSCLGKEGIEVTEIGQGYATMGASCVRLEELVLYRRLRHNGHPILRWNVDCCSVSTDPSGLMKPVKPERMQSSKRIDGVSALLDAITVWMAAENVEPAVWAL
jgi:phage terminase large subunit-like protein